MKYATTLVAIAASASATEFVGDGVPLVYAAQPYPNPPFDGVQYNATVINGVPFNSSNVWQCLTAEKYFTVPPPCARECLSGSFRNATLCDDDDFTCHCTQAGSDDLNTFVIPCFTAGIGGCTEEEAGQTINFVHAGICPYFKATTHDEAYGSCRASEDHPSPGQEDIDASEPSSSSWWWQGPKATSFAPIRGGYWPKPFTGAAQDGTFGPRTTSVQSVWEESCEGPTTLVRGTRTYTASEATIFTMSDSAITWTKAVSSGTWAPLRDDAPATGTVTADAEQTIETNTFNGAANEVTPVLQPQGTAAASGRTSSATFASSPAQFTGAASNNKAYVGAAAFVAVGAAIAI